MLSIYAPKVSALLVALKFNSALEEVILLNVASTLHHDVPLM